MAKLYKSLILTFVSVVVALTLNRAAFGQETQPNKTSVQSTTEGVSSLTVIVIHGKIVAVSKAKRRIVLEDAENKKVILNVENPHNLAALKVGEPVVARFYEIAEIRKKRPGEAIPESSVKEGIVSATAGGTPGAMVTGHVSIVVSVVSLDQASGMITVKGPDGAVETVKARDPKNLKRLNVGDELVVSISRAIALSVDRESPN
jgi:hypothetical protein